jgi:hypothetical protein
MSINTISPAGVWSAGPPYLFIGFWLLAIQGIMAVGIVLFSIGLVLQSRTRRVTVHQAWRINRLGSGRAFTPVESVDKRGCGKNLASLSWRRNRKGKNNVPDTIKSDCGHRRFHD